MKRVAPSVTSRIPFVVNQYGWTVKEVIPCASHYLKNAAYRTETDLGTVVIKPFRGSARRLRNISRLIRRLERHRYPNMPKWFTTLDHKPFVDYKGVRYYANQWIHGQPLGDSREDLYQLGVTLAELHALRLRSTKDPRVQNPTDGLQCQHQQFMRNLNQVQQFHSALGSWYKSHGDECAQLAETALRQLTQGGVYEAVLQDCHRPVITHGDVTRPNTIVTASGAVLIDWERVSLGVRYVELARALSNTTDFRRSRIQSLLEGYESVYALSPSEKLAVAMYFRFPREAWYIAQNRAQGKTAGDFEVLAAMWQRRLRAIRYLEEWAGYKSEESPS